MPFRIRKRNGKFCVEKKDGSKSFGCHDSHSKASAQIRAIEASERRK